MYTIGVGEEFLLVNPASVGTVPIAGTVLAEVAATPGTDFHPELQATQVEAASGPHWTARPGDRGGGAQPSSTVAADTAGPVGQLPVHRRARHRVRELAHGGAVPLSRLRDTALARLVECGALVDDRQTFWLARPSPHLPTVEVRAADAVTGVDEAVLQAALTRVLVRTALTELAEGRTGPRIPEQVAAAAVWTASRYGLTGPAVHPRLRRQTGDLAFARKALEAVLAHGTGAERQRRAMAAAGVRAVIDLLSWAE